MSNHTKTILVTGGIGVGKSVVCRVLSVMGCDVYDSDRGARHIMDNSDEIKRDLVAEFGDKVVVGNVIQRDVLASIVFGDSTKLARLNAIVHPVVLAHIDAMRRRSQAQLFFVETAIPRSSGLDGMADAIWLVEAPLDVRIPRVMTRSALTEQQVMARINAQRGEFDTAQYATVPVATIVNDNRHSVLGQILDLMQ